MTVMQTVDVAVPVTTAYNQWTQLEEFPKFMHGVQEVRQTDDTHSIWKVKILGTEREFQTKITEQLPDERIAWTTTHGDIEQAGVVTFHRLADANTRVAVQMDVTQGGLLEKLGGATGIVDKQISSDLSRFKEFIEERGTETGEWRGSVDRPKP